MGKFLVLSSLYQNLLVGRINPFTILLIFISVSPVAKRFGIEQTALHQLIFVTLSIAVLIFHREFVMARWIVFLVPVITIYLLLQTLVTGELSSLGLGIYRYVLIPIFAYQCCIQQTDRNRDIVEVLLPYLLINLGIFYVRVLYSYDFFGILDPRQESWMYRPSNLSSPIIFSIEIALILSLTLISDISTRSKIFLTIMCVIPLVLMHSRSSGLILLVSSLAILTLYRPSTGWITGPLLVMFGLLLNAFDIVNFSYFLSIFDFGEASYATRFQSLTVAVTQFLDTDIATQLLGVGSGIASQSGVILEFDVIYVESGIASLLIENGYLGGMFFFIFFLGAFVASLSSREKFAHITILLSLFLANFLSASLTVTSVWLITSLIISRVFVPLPKGQYANG
jgi:hypothetical protein